MERNPGFQSGQAAPGGWSSTTTTTTSDPGIPAVAAACRGRCGWIVKNYDVDGIHLDDYFYPGTDFADVATYERYGQDFSRIGDWRRDNVNTLIAALDETLHYAG